MLIIIIIIIINSSSSDSSSSIQFQSWVNSVHLPEESGFLFFFSTLTHIKKVLKILPSYYEYFQIKSPLMYMG